MTDHEVAQAAAGSRPAITPAPKPHDNPPSRIAEARAKSAPCRRHEQSLQNPTRVEKRDQSGNGVIPDCQTQQTTTAMSPGPSAKSISARSRVISALLHWPIDERAVARLRTQT
jgi:hypothetical protein